MRRPRDASLLPEKTRHIRAFHRARVLTPMARTSPLQQSPDFFMQTHGMLEQCIDGADRSRLPARSAVRRG